MWYELVVIIGAELVVLVAIAAMNLHNRRIDVLRGRYSAAELYCATSPGRNIDWSDEIELDYHATCAIGSRSRLVARTTGRS